MRTCVLPPWNRWFINFIIKPFYFPLQPEKLRFWTQNKQSLEVWFRWFSNLFQGWVIFRLNPRHSFQGSISTSHHVFHWKNHLKILRLEPVWPITVLWKSWSSLQRFRYLRRFEGRCLGGDRNAIAILSRTCGKGKMRHQFRKLSNKMNHLFWRMCFFLTIYPICYKQVFFFPSVKMC